RPPDRVDAPAAARCPPAPAGRTVAAEYRRPRGGPGPAGPVVLGQHGPRAALAPRAAAAAPARSGVRRLRVRGPRRADRGGGRGPPGRGPRRGPGAPG